MATYNFTIYANCWVQYEGSVEADSFEEAKRLIEEDGDWDEGDYEICETDFDYDTIEYDEDYEEQETGGEEEN